MGPVRAGTGREDGPHCEASMGPAREAAASKSLSVLSEIGTLGPVADTGCCAGLDRHDCVTDNPLSRDCLEIDMGLISATELCWVAPWDVCDR